MTLAPEAGDELPDLGPARRPRRARPAPQSRPTAHSWAVIELHADGSLGLPHLVIADDPVDATAISPRGSAPSLATVSHLPPALEAHLGRRLSADGRVADAVRVLSVGALAAAPSPARASCLGQLALAEAYVGDLRRATEHADLVLAETDTCGDEALAQALVAKARVHLHRGELDDCRRCLDLTTSATQLGAEPWLATNRLLVEAELLIAERQPDGATRLLANALEGASPVSTSPWLSDLLATARADSLLAAGEPQRALAAVTPLPPRAIVGATVVAAEARREIGDVRGAHAVLQTVVEELERSTVALQVRALLLESRLAGDRQDDERARLLLDRALRTADAEQMRTLLTRARPWLRRVVDQDHALVRTHRELLSSFETTAITPGSAAPTGRDEGSPVVGTLLTDREGQVLELLAQMYSTDEIAAELYVSANTVKTHLKGIFGKLCVNRRVDAVRRGRQLGLC